MSRVQKLYPSAKKHVVTGKINMETDAIKFALLGATYNPIPVWQATTVISTGEFRRPTSWNMHYYKAVTGGTTGSTQPTWLINGGQQADGTVTWQDMGVSVPLASPHELYADVSSFELAAGNGYTAGGVTVVNKVVTTEKFDADDVEFISLGTPAPVTFMWGVLYKSGTTGGVVNPLISLFLFDDTPNVLSDNYLTTTVTSGDYAIKWDATYGIMSLQPFKS